MAEDTALRTELRERTGWSQQAVSNRIRSMTPNMPRRYALYTLAVENGIEIERYGVPEADVVAVGNIVRQRAGDDEKNNTSRPRTRQKPAGRQQIRVSLPGLDLAVPASMKSGIASAGAVRSMKAFSILYVVENSVREVIRRVLMAAEGHDWWEERVPQKVQEHASRWMDQDNDTPWHAPRGDHPIYYVGFSEYVKIIKHNWKLFEPVFDRVSFVEENLLSLNVSRRVIAHVAEIKPDGFQLLEAHAKKWLKQVQARENRIPAAD